MFGADIFKRASSLSAAVSFLLSSNHAQANVPTSAAPKLENANERPFEPLLLKSASPQVMDEVQFAGHQSHSSHYSSSGGYRPSHYSSSYVPTYVAPTPRPTPRPAPVYVPRTYIPPTYVAPTPRVTPTPVPVARAIPVRNIPTTPVSRIEFKNGAIFLGHVLVKSAAGITLETQDQTTHKIPRRLLTDATIKGLQLPPVAP